MNSQQIKRCSLVVMTMLMLGATPAFAQEAMNLDGINSNYLQQVNITFNGNSENVYSGAITGTLGGGPSQYFFCYDLNNLIDVPGNYTVNALSPTSSFPSYLQLPSNFNLEVAASLLNNVNLPTFSNVNQFSGLQLAIWSILYNWTPTSQPTTLSGTGTTNFSSSVTGDILSDAQSDLNLALNYVANPTSSMGNWQVLVNANDAPGSVIQTLVGVGTPEPGTYLTLSSFLIIAGLSYRKLKLKQIE